MGSSVFHGGFATFLAIICLSYSKSYVQTVFYKLWFGIVIFGMANGFIFLPVILSIFGPLSEAESKRKTKELLAKSQDSASITDRIQKTD